MTDTLKSDLNDVISALLEAGLGLKSTHVAAVEKAIAELDRLEAEVKKPRLPEGVKLSKLQDEVIKIETPGQTPDYAAPGHQAYDFVASFLPTPDVAPSTEPVQAAGEMTKPEVYILDTSQIAGPALHCLEQFLSIFRHGGQVDILGRRDGKEYRFQADWAKYLKPLFAPAEVPNQDKGYQTPMNTETAEKPKPVSLVSVEATEDLERWIKADPDMPLIRADVPFLARKFRKLLPTLDQERGV